MMRIMGMIGTIAGVYLIAIAGIMAVIALCIGKLADAGAIAAAFATTGAALIGALGFAKAKQSQTEAAGTA